MSRMLRASSPSRGTGTSGTAPPGGGTTDPSPGGRQGKRAHEATARALWLAEPGRAELREVRLPRPGPAEVRVRTRFGAVSRGTEALVFDGRVPPELYDEMRAPFQEGSFPAPVKYGYIAVGEVEAGPAELLGRTVFCLHPHQTRFVVPAEAVAPLPEGVPADRAVLAANIETAVTALWDAAPLIGERILVVGAGLLGLLVAYLAARIPGARVTVVDIDPARAGPAQAMGARFATPEATEGAADLALHASGTGAGLAWTLGRMGPEGRIVDLSWYGTDAVTLPLGGSFHPHRLTLRASQVGRVPPGLAARWSRADRMALALGLLADPVLDVLITGECRFEALPETLHRLARTPQGALCHRIRYD